MTPTAATTTLESLNPATGAVIGAVQATAPGDVQAVVDAVAKVQPFWAQLTLRDRARYMERAAQVLIDESDEIRDLIVAEQGKPRNEAFTMEILPTIDALHWIARAGQEILADEKVSMPQLFLKTKHSAFTYEPLGVVAVISPWNYPWSIPFGEIALALMAGNGVVLKPASLTPLIGERIGRALERAGVPEGLVRVIHGPGTGPALVQSTVAKVFFTGSVQAGRSVGEACARQLKGSVLELGGKDPMIVLADANLDHAIGGALWGGFANAGQTCSGIERVYVLDEVAERFVDGVIRGAQQLRVGDPMRWDTEIGPMINLGAVRARRRARGRRGCVRGVLALRRTAGARSRGPERLLLRPHRAERRDARDADHAGGDLRTCAPDRRGEIRGRGGAARERQRVRPRRLGVDVGSQQGGADRARARVRDGVDQRPHVQPRRLPVLVGRGQGVGPRANAFEVRPL